jgi:FkbM family methyltransferase
MLLDTRILFFKVLKKINSDLVLDIGSCDGTLAIYARNMMPKSKIGAIEANPYNFAKMKTNEFISKQDISLYNCAISSVNGEAVIYIPKADYDSSLSADNNTGMSSLLPTVSNKMDKIEEVKVKTYSLETFILSNYPNSNIISLWIDVESAEYQVLSGINAISDKIKLIHLESSYYPLRNGQICLDKIEELLIDKGFVYLGRNFEKTDRWGGDIVFIKKETYNSNLLYIKCLSTIAMFYKNFGIDKFIKYIKKRTPRIFNFIFKRFF